MPKAVVLLSGGLDSTTTLAVAKSQGFEVYALSVDYGQRHRVELERAESVAKALGVVEHRTVRLDLRAIGGSALTAAIDVPKDRSADEMGHGIPITYVPARNTILLGPGARVRGDGRGVRPVHRGERPRLLRLPRLPAGVPGGVRAAGQPGDEGRRRRRRADSASTRRC